MPHHTINRPVVIAVTLATAFACLGFAPAAALERASTAEPAPAATATPQPGGVATAAPHASPTPTPAPTPSAAPAITGDDPDLATQNRAGNHAMGSTIATFDAAAQTAAPRSLVATPSVAPPGVPGLDVSGWQTNVNWAQVVANGAKFAYVKATESVDYRSSQFASQYNGSYAAGLIRGAYHFAIPNETSGAAQANFFMDNGGSWTQDGRTLPPLLDIEYNPYTATDHTDTCYGLSPQAMVSWIADFSNTIYQRTGRLPAIYSTTGWWTQCTGNSPAFGNNPLFIARYPSNIANGAGTLPAGWNAYTMWQWASSGVFPGDQDVFNGSVATLQQFAYTGRALAQPVIGTGDLNGDGKPDLLARRPDGTLWFYAGQGASGSSVGYAAGLQVGTQWGIFDDLLFPGDITGDGVPDLLGRKTNGTIMVYPISPSGGGGISIGDALVLSSGWDAFTDVIAAGDVDGDKKPDVLGRKPDGTLWLYSGTGRVDSTSTGFEAGKRVGTSWNVFTQVIGIGDLDRDGWDDLLGIRLDGSVWYYRGSAAGYQAGARVSANGVVAGDLLIAAGDANGDGRPDLLTRSASGALKFSAGTMLTQPAFGASQTVGSGWGIFNRVIGAGDVNADGSPDIVATTSGGDLYLYAGNGSSGGVNKSYRGGVRIGWGWTDFTKVLNGGDFTGDGRPDLLAVRIDGSLWLYPSTGVVNPTTPSTYAGGIRIGTTGWNGFSMLAAGDFTGDGMPDVLATRPDGSAVLYPGIRQTPSSTSWLGTPVAVGPGWNVYSSIVSTGDSNGDGRSDVIATRPDGTLWILAGTGASSGGLFSPAAVIGSGWNIFTSVTSTGDRSSGRTGDLVGVRTDGALLYYPSTNVAAIANIPGYSTTVVAGSGWNIFG